MIRALIPILFTTGFLVLLTVAMPTTLLQWLFFIFALIGAIALTLYTSLHPNHQSKE